MKTKALPQIGIPILLSFLIMMLLGAPAVARTWSGTVRNAITGEPIEGVRVQAGVPGRVDPFSGHSVHTDGSGRFSIPWPSDAWNSWNAGSRNHYLRFSKDDHWGILLARPQPEQGLDMFMTPLLVFIQGQLLDGANGRPLPDVRLSIALPGSVRETVRTDHEGMFSFEPLILYAEYRSQNSRVHDYPLEMGLDWTPIEVGPYTSISLRIRDSGFNNDWVGVPAQSMKPSADGEVYTFVTLVALEPDELPRIQAEVVGLQATQTLPQTAEHCISPDAVRTLAHELKGMIQRAETNSAAHPDFLADLYRWLGELENLDEEPVPQWGTY